MSTHRNVWCVHVCVKVKIKTLHTRTHAFSIRTSWNHCLKLSWRACVCLCMNENYEFLILNCCISCSIWTVLHSVTLFIRCKQLPIYSSRIRTALWTIANQSPSLANRLNIYCSWLNDRNGSENSASMSRYAFCKEYIQWHGLQNAFSCRH